MGKSCSTKKNNEIDLESIDRSKKQRQLGEGLAYNGDNRDDSSLSMNNKNSKLSIST